MRPATGLLMLAVRLVIQGQTAQPDQWDRLRWAGQEASQAGRYADALAHFEKALRATGPEDADRQARTLNDIGAMKHQLGRYREAEEDIRHSIRLRQTAAPDAAELATATNNLASILHHAGRNREAAEAYQTALAARRKLFTADSTPVLSAMNSLATAYLYTDRPDLARKLIDEALRHCESGACTRPQLHARLLGTAGEVSRREGRLDEARRLLRQSLEAHQRVTGAEHPETLAALANLAGLDFEQGRHDDARQAYEQVIRLREAALGPSHPVLAIPITNLALVLMAERRDAEAEPLLRRALAIRETAFGPDHVEVADVLEALALLFLRTDRNPAAERTLRRVLAIREQSLPPGHPATGGTASRLAESLARQGRATEADRLIRSFAPAR